MRRLSPLALAALLAMALPMQAQEPQPSGPQGRPGQEAGPQRRGPRGRGDLQALGLSDEQKQKLREIRQQYANDPEGRHKAVEAILTPEQREKLKEMRRERRRALQGAPRT